MIEGIAQMKRRVRTALARQKPLQRRIGQGITVPGLPTQKRQEGSVWAVTMVRNEADVIAHSVRHLLRQGIDGVIVADNLSTDRTLDVLRNLAAKDSRVYVGTDSMAEFHQGRKMSHLANLARNAGAEWVILLDADEFWFAKDQPVADYLRSLPPTITVVEASLTDAHAVTVDGIDLDAPDTMVRVDDAPNSKKVAIRPPRWVWVDNGNHTALDLGRAQDHGLRILHLPRRSFAQLEQKVTQGAAALDAATTIPESVGHHWRSAALQPTDERRAAWVAEVAHQAGQIQAAPTRWRTWTDRA